MVRCLIALAVCVLLTAGCGSRHRPVVRRSQSDPGREDSSQVESPETPDPTTRREPPDEIPGREVNLGRMCLTAPESWLRKRPAVSFILAEFSLPHVEGDAADGRLTVSEVGGSVEENVERWRGQFAGKPQEESEDQVEIAGIEVTLVDFSGTYIDRRGPMTPVVERPDYRLLGAILPIEGQLYFLKCYGPERTVAERADEFHAFVRSLGSSAPLR
jgi:hypothetical protein